MAVKTDRQIRKTAQKKVGAGGDWTEKKDEELNLLTIQRTPYRSMKRPNVL